MPAPGWLKPQLEAALGDGPLCAPCPHGHGLLFAPGWWCDDGGAVAFPDMLRDADDEPDADYG
jgi:hypothetical protein